MVEQRASGSETGTAVRGVWEFDARVVRAAVEQLAVAAGVELSSEAPEDVLDAMAEALRTLSIALFGERQAAVRLGRLFAAALDGLPDDEQPADDGASYDWDDFGGFSEDDGLGEGDAPIGFVLVDARTGSPL